MEVSLIKRETSINQTSYELRLFARSRVTSLVSLIKALLPVAAVSADCEQS